MTGKKATTMRTGKKRNGSLPENLTVKKGREIMVDGVVQLPLEEDYRVKISTRFILLSLLSCALLAYAVGRTARVVLIDGPQERLLASFESQQQLQAALQIDGSNSKADRVMKLPNPVLKNKPIPNTIYSAMNFDTSRSSSINSRWVVVENSNPQPSQSRNASSNSETCDSSSDSCESCSRGKESVGNNNAMGNLNEEGDGEIHLPAGQHLLMDIRNVESAFLASEERLATAMLDVVGDCGLTLLSYHCHGLQPSGVSCVGVLLER